MSRHEANRSAACYHTFVAILLLLLGGGLLGLGIWLRVTERGGPSSLDYERANLPNVMSWVSLAAIVVGGFFLLAAVSALFALSRKCVGMVFRVVYVLMALVILAALVLIAAASFFILDRRDAPFVGDALQSAWSATVADRPQAVCEVEKALMCRGFRDASCVAETCASCPMAVKGAEAMRSCYGAIVDDLRRVYLPAGIVAVVAGVFVLIDIFVTCAL